MWCERAHRPFLNFRMGEETQLSLSVGAQLPLTPFCCAKQYSITTWERRKAKTHPLLQLLELCNHSCNLPYVPRYPPGSHFSCQLPLLPAIIFSLPVTSYLLFSVIVSRPQGFRFLTGTRERDCFSLALSLELKVLFPMGVTQQPFRTCS